jgi:hypothetical protein
MAKKSGNKPSDAELKEQIERSRENLERRLSRVREEVDLPRRIRRSVRREPVPWIVGAIAVGLLVTAVVTRRRKIVVDAKTGSKSKGALLEAGFILGALRIAATLLKPVIVNLVEKKLIGQTGPSRSERKGF